MHHKNKIEPKEYYYDYPHNRYCHSYLKLSNTHGADTKALVVTAENNEVVVKSAANIPGVLVTFANLINVYDILNAKKLVVDKAALAKIEEVFA